MSLDSVIFLILFVVSFFITMIKRNMQLGKTWGGPLNATVIIKDKELRCGHCGHTKFKKREGLLATTWVAYFRLTFWNRSVPCYVCSNCGFVHWFLSPKEEAEITRDTDQ